MARIVAILLLGTLSSSLANASSPDLPAVEMTPPEPPAVQTTMPDVPAVQAAPPEASPIAGSGFVPYGPPPGGTELWFESEGGPVGVYLVSGPPAPDTGAPAPVGRICETPCRLFVPNGSYVFEAEGESFSLHLAGGSEAVTLDPFRPGLATAGWILFGSGLASSLAGAVMLAMADELGSPFLKTAEDYRIDGGATLGVGLAFVAASIAMLLAADGSVERRDLASGGPSGYPFTVGFDLAPASRGIGAGLRLALTF